MSRLDGASYRPLYTRIVQIGATDKTPLEQLPEGREHGLRAFKGGIIRTKVRMWE